MLLPSKCKCPAPVSTRTFWTILGPATITEGMRNCFFFWLVQICIKEYFLVNFIQISSYVVNFFMEKVKKNHCKKPYLFSIKDSNNTVIGSKLSCQILYLVLAIQPVLGTGIARNCDWHDYLLSKYCWTSGHCRCHGFILLKCLQCTWNCLKREKLVYKM